MRPLNAILYVAAALVALVAGVAMVRFTSGGSAASGQFTPLPPTSLAQGQATAAVRAAAQATRETGPTATVQAAERRTATAIANVTATVERAERGTATAQAANGQPTAAPTSTVAATAAATTAATTAPARATATAASTAAPAGTAAPASTGTADATSTAGFVLYTVQPGDSLKLIATRYNVTVADILENNTIANPDSLTVGAVLRIPQP